VDTVYAAQLRTLERITQYLPKDPKTRVTMLEILGKTRNENLFSRLLRYFLETTPTSIGTSPLEVLFELADIPTAELDLSDVEVVVEHTFPANQTRIDLLVVAADSVVVGIENKVDAAERDDQTVDYWDGMRAEFNDQQCFGVLLSPDGRTASSPRFASIAYADLVAGFRSMDVRWLADVQHAVFWEDFLEHMERHVASGNSIPDRTPLVDLYIEHRSMLEDLNNAYEAYRRRLVEHIVENAREVLSENDDEHVWEFNAPRALEWQQIYRKHWKTAIPRLDVHFEYWNIGRPLAKPMQFMVDVERDRDKVDQFLDAFQRRMARFEAEYVEKGIVFRPSNRKHALAFKEYPPASSIEALVETCRLAAAEFQFLTAIIEDTFDELQEGTD